MIMYKIFYFLLIIFKFKSATNEFLLFLFTVDITVYYGGFHGDLNETFFVGNVSNEAKQLVNVTHECLMQAIDIGGCF